MKNSSQTKLDQLPDVRKSLYSLSACLTSLTAALVVGWHTTALAQSDDFNNGNDTTPVAWTHYDPIFTASGGTSTTNTYDASTGEYHLTAVPSPDPTLLGPARTGSYPDDNYTNFYVTVDVTGWDNTYVQPFGILARGQEYGPATTDGYLFGYANADALLGPGNGYITIIRMQDEFGFNDIPGSGPAGDTLVQVDLDPTKDYRFVFIGMGTYLEGRVYELPNVTTPIAVVIGNTAGDAVQLTEGRCGVFMYNWYDSGGNPFAGPVDVTYDNYYARSYCPLAGPMKVVDDFNDGNDTSPPWTHYDPLADYGAAGTFSFPGGNTYRIQAAASPDPGLGQGRAGSMWAQNYSDFIVSVDLVNWDDTMHQIVGLLVRATDIGLGQTKGYIWTHDRGNPANMGGDMDMIVLDGEAVYGDVTTTGADSIYMATNKSYRFAFKAEGSQLTGEVFELPDLVRPVVSMTGTDDISIVPYVSGALGVLTADNSTLYDQPTDATFDNFSIGVVNPSISIDGSSGTAVVTWPGNLPCIWVLESSPSINPGATWTPVALTDVVYAAGQNTYTATSPMASTGNTYYRLRKI